MENSIDTLKQNLKTGQIGQLYVFHGPESFLREHYVREIKKALVAPELEGFNLEALEGARLGFAVLRDAVESLPFMGERKLVLVTDYPICAPGAADAVKLLELIDDLPESVCLVFVYDTLEYKNDGRTKLSQTLKKNGLFVEFPFQKEDKLIRWACRRAASAGKDIGYADAERMVFLCGADMQNLKNELDKLITGTERAVITREDIERLVTPTPEAGVYSLTNAIAANQPKKAARLLLDLETAGDEPPVRILAVITSQMLNLYAARLLLDAHKNADALAAMCGMRTSYQAKITMESARTRPLPWFRHALRYCYEADLTIKGGVGRERALELLLGRLFTPEETV